MLFRSPYDRSLHTEGFSMAEMAALRGSGSLKSYYSGLFIAFKLKYEVIRTDSTRASPLMDSTTEFHAKSSFGSFSAREAMAFEARSSSRRCTRVTREPKRVRKVASSTAESPPPITAMGLSRKKAPSQVAHQETMLYFE